MKKINNKIIILLSACFIFIVAFLIFILNYSKDETSFSILEKKWLNDNKNDVIDVSVYNDIPVFGESGNGIIFDYLEKFTEEHGIKFNKVSYVLNNNVTYKNLSFKILGSSEKVNDNDIVLYEDYYVIVSLENDKVDNISDLNNAIMGVDTSDISLATYYLSDAKKISYKTFKDIETMLESLKEKEITHLLLPFNQYLDTILENDLNIVYQMNDITKKYVLSVKDDKTLLNVLKKYTLKYEEEYFDEVYKNNFMNLVFSSKDITEEEKMGYNANSYIYGYVTNVPYEVKDGEAFSGIISNYLSGFEDLYDVDFKTARYDDINSLKQALSKGEVDLVFGNFNTDGVNVDRIFTGSIFDEEYVILSKDTKYLNSVRSLKDKEVSVVKDSYLHSFVQKNGIIAKTSNNTDELIRNLEDNDIVIVDLDTYMYYKNKKFSKFNIIYSGSIDNNYNFIIRDVNKNKTFSDLFSFYVSTINYNDVRYLNNISDNYLSNNMFNVLKNIAIILFIIVLILGIIIFVRKKKNKEKIIKKDDKLKFIDAMTSLKNRNYLNYNMKKWDDNVIYPQSFIVVDLNNIKYVNDNHGHEEGDNVIKKAASILIINQLENTDIMRTDGNEFLIYMVGYEEKEVIAYTRKIYKELKDLPYGFGACIGYSMITDDVKTVDDAINEATLEMRKAKSKE